MWGIDVRNSQTPTPNSQGTTSNSHGPAPRAHGLTRTATLAFVAVLFALMASQPSAQGTKAAMQQDPACQSLTPVSAGGPAPKDPNTVVVRWLSFTNYELAYRDNVLLLDTYFDQTPRRHSPGVAVKDFKKANAIFIGHAHFDHISDAPAIAKQTGGVVVGGAGAPEYLKQNGLADGQIKLVKSGDVLRYPGVTVEAVQGAHSSPAALKIPAEHNEKQTAAIAVAALQAPFTEAEKAQDTAVRARGNTDPRVATEGMLDYLFTFGNNFRVLFVDSNGGITDALRRLSAGVDVGLFPWQYFEAGIPALTELVKVTSPSTVFLGNHDGVGTMGWASNYPAALAIRETNPKTRTMDVIYRTPVCFNTASKDMVIGW